MVRRVAKDLIANDEAEISEVVRRRLFEDLGSEKIRRNVARAFGDWCFERRAQLPPEWTAVDSASTEAKAREFLQGRFEACYPFHPATLSVFQRKWQSLPQYQQTRGTLAMLAQWISLAAQEAFTKARNEPLITLGSAPLAEPGFRSVVLGQLGESATDRRDRHGHRRRSGAQQGARRRYQGTAARHPPTRRHRDPVRVVRRADGQGRAPAGTSLRARRAADWIRRRSTPLPSRSKTAPTSSARSGSDGFRIGYQPTMKKVVSDRRASLDEETEIKPAMRKLVEEEFRRGGKHSRRAVPAGRRGDS